MGSEFKPASLLVLGRQPKLGLAELESLYGAEHLQPIGGGALLDVEAADINFKRLGGTIKVAKLLNILPTASWEKLEQYLIKNIPQHLKHLPDGQFTLGLSVYGQDIPVPKIHKSLMKIKKLVRGTGRPMRVVPNKNSALSSAQVLHNKLTSRGGWELIFYVFGGKTYLAQTMFVQDIEAYAARDQARPKRDAWVGMLPPKLAQIILNLANPPKGTLVLDPFCGTGVVLQEALLGGFKALGTDVDERMVEYSRLNLDWLSGSRSEISGNYELRLGDATNYVWGEEIGAVASELFLGKPLSRFPELAELSQITAGVTKILEGFLNNLSTQIKPGTPICLAVPAWRRASGEIEYLPKIDHLTDMGYNYLDFKHVRQDELVYFRPNQIVARQLLTLRKS